MTWRHFSSRRRNRKPSRSNLPTGRDLGVEQLEERRVLAAYQLGNLLVASSPFDQTPTLSEYSIGGALVQSTAVPNPTGVSTELPRDIVLDRAGKAQVYNGTFDPRLSTYDPVADTWSQTKLPLWSSGNNVSYGGLAALNEFVIATDMRVRSELSDARGLVRFNVFNLDSGWTKAKNVNIGDSTTDTSTKIPHVTIHGTGDGSFDYYSFTVVNAGDRAIFDIDNGDTGGPGSFHSSLRLFDESGAELARSAVFNAVTLGQQGSVSNKDAYLEYTFAAPGRYVIEVGGCCLPEGIPQDATYDLQVSVTNHSLFVPGGLAEVTEVEPNNTTLTAQNSDSAQRFVSSDGDPIDVAVGLDGLVYALVYTGAPDGGASTVKVYDPADFELLRTVTLPENHRAIAVDEAGHIYAANPAIVHYDANGARLGAINNPVGGVMSDIDIKAGSCEAGVPSYACLAVSTANGYIITTTTALDDYDFFQVYSGTGLNFVAFVEPPLQLPKATDDVYRVAEDTTSNTLNVLINDLVDSRGNLSIVAVGTPDAGGSAQIVGGRSLRYTPQANFTGKETFTYTVSDGLGSTSQATVSVEVSDINENPQAADDAYEVFEDSVGNVLTVLDNDSSLPDVGETLSLTAAGPASDGGSVSIQDGFLVYSPAANFTGVATIPYSIDDGRGGTASAVATITVVNINDNPTAVDDNLAVNPNTQNNPLDVLNNDSDAPDSGETLTLVDFTAPSHGTAFMDGNLIRYTPTAGYLGADSLTYRISDNNGGFATATVSITVTVVNNPPVAGDDAYQINRNSVNNRLLVLQNDTFAPDVNETLTITGVTSPNRGGSVTIADGGTTLRYSPPPQFAGTETFQYQINDGRGGTDIAVVTITVGNFNSQPVPENDSYSVQQNSLDNPLDVLANDFDPDGTDVLTIFSVGATANGGLVTILPGGGGLLYTPPQPFLGTDSFIYTVSDGRGGTADATVSISVVGWQNPNNPLDVDNDTFVVPQDAAILINELNFPTIISPNGKLPTATATPTYFYDVNGDQYLSPSDVLRVVNALNAVVPGGGGEGEADFYAAWDDLASLTTPRSDLPMPAAVAPTVTGSLGLVRPLVDANLVPATSEDSPTGSVVTDDEETEDLLEVLGSDIAQAWRS